MSERQPQGTPPNQPFSAPQGQPAWPQMPPGYPPPGQSGALPQTPPGYPPQSQPGWPQMPPGPMPPGYVPQSQPGWPQVPRGGAPPPPPARKSYTLFIVLAALAVLVILVPLGVLAAQNLSSSSAQTPALAPTPTLAPTATATLAPTPTATLVPTPTRPPAPRPTPTAGRGGLPDNVPLLNTATLNTSQATVTYRLPVAGVTITAISPVWTTPSPDDPASIVQFYLNNLPGNGWSYVHTQPTSESYQLVSGCQGTQVVLIEVDSSITLTDFNGTPQSTIQAPPGGAAFAIYFTASADPELQNRLCQ